MNNTELLEKLGKHYLSNIQFCEEYLSEEVVGEYDMYGGPMQFIKDSIKFLFKIKRLKNEQEIIIDLISPPGFLSIYKDNDTYLMNLAIKGMKTIEYKSKKAGDIIAKVISLLKDQVLVGRKELKNARS